MNLAAETASVLDFDSKSRPLMPSDNEMLSQLAGAYPYKAYRNYRAISPETQLAAIKAEVQEALSAPKGSAYIAIKSGAPAVAIARRLSWDSDFFGVEMARLDYVLGSDPGARDAALGGLLEELRGRGIRHVAARVDAADYQTGLLLQEHSFHYMGALLTHVARPGKEEPREVRQVGTIRLFEEADAAGLVAIATEAFAGTASRFHMDPHLPRDRAEQFYAEWARACVSGKMADTILVAEDEQRLIGFLAFREVNPISQFSEVRIFGGGLGACRTSSGGAYAGLIRAGVLWGHERGAIAEVQTPADNTAAIHIFESVGFSHRRTDYLFHLWLPGPGSSQAGPR